MFDSFRRFVIFVKCKVLGVLRYRHEIKCAIGKIISIELGQISRAVNSQENIFEISDAVEFHLPDISFVEGHSKQIFNDVQNNSYSSFGISVFKVPRVHLVDTYAVPVTSSRRVISEHMHGTRQLMLRRRPYKYLTQSFTPVRERYNNVYSINSFYSYNYFHWFMDCLTNLHAYEWYKNNVSNECDLLLPDHHTHWQNRSLDLMGYSENDYIRYQSRHTVANNLIIPSYPKFRSTELPAVPSLIFWMRERMLSTRNRCSETLPQYIFIHRKDALKGSRINNEDQLAKTLSEIGFVSVILSELKLDLQIDYFSNAKIIVAGHGAGLTNLIFANKPKVLELFRPEQLNSRKAFFLLTNIIGGDHKGMFSEIDQNGKSIINIDLVIRTVSSWM